MRYISFLFLLGIFSNFSYGQNTTIIIPDHGDKYSAYIKSLEVIEANKVFEKERKLFGGN